MIMPPHIYTLFPYTTLFRSPGRRHHGAAGELNASQEASEASEEATEAPGKAASVSEEARSEEHTSELQSRGHLVCRLLLEKNNIILYLLYYIDTLMCIS